MSLQSFRIFFYVHPEHILHVGVPTFIKVKGLKAARAVTPPNIKSVSDDALDRINAFSIVNFSHFIRGSKNNDTLALVIVKRHLLSRDAA